MGGSVCSVVRAHKLNLQQIRYTGRGQAKNLARLWDVEKVVVGDAITVDDEAGNPSDVWGKHVVIYYTRPGTLARAEPTFAHTLHAHRHALRRAALLRPRHQLVALPVCEEYTAEVVDELAHPALLRAEHPKNGDCRADHGGEDHACLSQHGAGEAPCQASLQGLPSAASRRSGVT